MGYAQLSDAIGFGKHKDKTVWWVMVNDIDYMQWMVNQENLKAKLLCLPKVQQDIIYMNLNKAHQRKIDKLEAWA
jgi:hypothetical protein